MRPGRVKPKTIRSVFIAFLLITEHEGERVKSEVTYIPATVISVN